MRFDWDADKRVSNLAKHGVDFADVTVVFESRMLVIVDSRKDYGEIRYIGIGMSKGGEVTLVWTERDDMIRLISARRAHAKERALYHK
jgi:uncharacterized DUF497 family protein